MQDIWEFLKLLTDPHSIIRYGGLALLLFVVFSETGLLVGFFLPGDSLIFISGLICSSQPDLLNINIVLLITLLCIAAILGNIVGFWFGKRVGPAIFTKDDNFIFKKRYVAITRRFYDRYGGTTLILGRFLPIIRTFAPILAGVIKLDFRIFMLYNIIGAVGWISSFGLLGYYLGTFTWIQNNVGYIVIGLIVITIIPVIKTYMGYKKEVNKI